MTLARQLVTALSIICLAMLLGIEALNLKSTRDHLQDQLESHAQDAATSIGLSLGILLKPGDYAIAETVINAAFDRGSYAAIEFVTRERSEPVVTRRIPVESGGDYPAWIARVFPLTAPTAESLVTTGWTQLGRVRVTSHPRFAYEQLWNTARNTLVWMAIIYAVTLLVLQLFLRNLLRPLTAIEKAAEAISARNFVTIPGQPRTRELARVVAAMNSLSHKVRDALEAETARAQALQEAAYRDPVSGLLNRAGLGAQFNTRFRDDAQSFSGVLALLQITDLAKVNETQGPERGDELVRGVAKTLSHAVDGDGLAGRWGGALFALVLPETAKGEIAATLTELQRQAEAAVGELGLEAGSVKIAIGAIHGDGGRPVLKDLVDAANEALQQAADTQLGAPEIRAADATRAAWSEALIGVVRESIATARMELVGQPALSLADGSLLHTEIMGRLLDGSGKQLTAAEFMPLVARHDLTVELDQAIVRKVLYSLKGRAEPCTLAVNLSAQSITDAAFVEWLTGLLRHGRPPQAQLVFEISEHGVLQNEPAARDFAGKLQAIGVSLGIDHFGVHRDSLALVRTLTPAYCKLSAAHTPRIARDSGTRFLIESLVRAGRQLDVPMIAQGVEDEAVLASLRELGVDAYQGWVSGRPQPWPPAA